MPRPFQYTRKRFQLMQLGMVVVLAATIGVAAIVDRTRSKAGDVELTQLISIGEDISVAVPEGWAMNIDNEDHYVQLTEPTGDHRSLVVRRRDVLLLDGVMMPTNTSPIPFGELGRGLLVTLRPPPTSRQPSGQLTHHLQLIARSQTPDGDLLEIVLDSPGSDAKAKPLANDVDLVKQIAKSVHRRGGDGDD